MLNLGELHELLNNYSDLWPSHPEVSCSTTLRCTKLEQHRHLTGDDQRTAGMHGCAALPLQLRLRSLTLRSYKQVDTWSKPLVGRLQKCTLFQLDPSDCHARVKLVSYMGYLQGDTAPFCNPNDHSNPLTNVEGLRWVLALLAAGQQA